LIPLKIDSHLPDVIGFGIAGELAYFHLQLIVQLVRLRIVCKFH